MLTNKRQWIAALFVLSILLAAAFNILAFTPQGLVIASKSEVTINSKGQRVYRNIPFTGEMVSYFKSGQQETADQFVNGRRQGYAKKWFKSGVLGFESFYVAGRRDGYTRSWWSNGNIRSEFFYITGQPQGVAWRWYKSGPKFKRFNYQMGKPVGLQQAWRENGKLSSNFEYKNGRTYGLKKANSCVGLEDEKISLDYYQNQASNNF